MFDIVFQLTHTVTKFVKGMKPNKPKKDRLLQFAISSFEPIQLTESNKNSFANKCECSCHKTNITTWYYFTYILHVFKELHLKRLKRISQNSNSYAFLVLFLFGKMKKKWQQIECKNYCENLRNCITIDLLWVVNMPGGNFGKFLT